MKYKFPNNIKNGNYSALYFNRSTKVVKQYLPNQSCLMQFTFFGKQKVKVCGIEESVALLKTQIPSQDLKKIKIYGAKDGQMLSPKSPVLLIEGPYQYFGIYENIIDGILARRSSVCNNVNKILSLISPSQLIYMADRTDDYLLQPYDGYAAYIGGARKFVTEASVSLIDNKKDIEVTGTMPHALIQQCGGNINKAISLFNKAYGNKCIALIDYHNDVVNEIKQIHKQFPHLYAVRIDTSANLIDKSLPKNKNNYGVCVNLIKLTRKTLDKYGMHNTKITVSSGLNDKTISNFVSQKLPIDFYGVGSFLITRNIHFTADLVMLNNQPQAKVGRQLFINYKDIKKRLVSY
jgi:nicotinate phosphoribosyltransferase